MKNYEFKDEKEVELLAKVMEVFLRLGIKKVTMDDISKELKVSKKTLYKYVKNRSELVSKVMHLSIMNDQKVINDIKENRKNAIQENKDLLSFFKQRVASIHPTVHYDLERYFPEAWAEFQVYQHEFVFDSVLENIETGRKEGFYKTDLDAKIVAKLYVSRVDQVFDGETFPTKEFEFSEVYKTLVLYHLGGICTEKGLKEVKTLDFSNV